MRRPLVSLLLAAAIPILSFGGWVAHVTAEQDRAAARSAAFASTARVAERVEADLAAQIQVLSALAASLSLEEENLPRFYLEAERLKAAQPLWETVELSTAAGQQVLNLLRPFGQPLGAAADPGSFAEASRTLRPVVGGIGPTGPVSGKRLVSLRVPVLSGGALRYVLTVALATNAVSSILREAGAPEGWVGIVVDRRGNIIARTAAEEAEIGPPAGPALRAAIARAPEGFYIGPTLEGAETETAYRTLARTGGWSVHFGIPTDVLNAPVSRSWYLLLAGALASLALAGLLAALTAWDAAQRRRDEELRMQLALRVSEERGSVAIEAAELGTLRWDAERGEVVGSERCRALLGLAPSPADGDEPQWPVAAVLAAVHADDRARLHEAVRLCLAEDVALDIEFRALREDGRSHWLRATGRAPRLGDEGGKRPAVVYGVIADIEPRKRAEAERLDLLRRLSQAQENEQRRIARELHDQVGQTVTGLSIGLKGLERMIGAGTDADAHERIRWLQTLAAEIGRDIHRAALDLRPTALDDLGLYKALDAFAAEWSGRHGIGIDLQVIGDDRRRLPAEIETAAYRIVQEALTNVLRHADAQNVSVVLEPRASRLQVIIEDDGSGFDPDAMIASAKGESRARAPARLGLSGIRERLTLLGGTMTLETAPGSGTSLFLQIPLAPSETP